MYMYIIIYHYTKILCSGLQLLVHVIAVYIITTRVAYRIFLGGGGGEGGRDLTDDFVRVYNYVPLPCIY